MKLFTVIETGVLLLALYLYLSVIRPSGLLLEMIFLAFSFSLVAFFLPKAKNRWKWLGKTIEAQTGVLLLVGMFACPLVIEFILFGFGR